MVNRTLKLSKNNSLFLFGARGTGKSTLIRRDFQGPATLWIDLLTETDEERFGKHPDQLSTQLTTKHYKYVVIDEIQKFPKLLDVVHKEIESRKNKTYFILTGSSARKLKRSHANLLGGRAINYSLFPFTHVELGETFDLQSVLQFGSLPLLLASNDEEKKEDFLRSYVRNYIREEVLIEQLIRQIQPFQDFLEVAAQMNGEILNFSKIAKDVGVSDQTVKSFFQVLEDTLIGSFLPPFHRSIRKRQRESPKFYFFDLGVKRALARELKVPLTTGTYAFGKSFEHFIMLELFRVCDYQKNDFKLSYLRTKDDAEIDVIIERPGRADVLLEIKSSERVDESDVRTLLNFQKDWDKKVVSRLWSLDPLPQTIEGVKCLPWKSGFLELFG